MRSEFLEHNRYENIKQTSILLLSMMTLVCVLGWVLGGVGGLVFAVGMGAALLILNPYQNSIQFLKRLRAAQLDPQLYPELHYIVRKISQRAELPHLPKLYCIPSKVMNAFVIGKEKDAAIVLTDSLLGNLNTREVAGILSHEVAHIYNKDLWVMAVGEATVRIAHFLSTAGQVILLFALPAVFMGNVRIAPLPLLMLFFAPALCLILYLALSRTREFEADRMGVELVGDVYGLVSALEKLDRYHKGIFSSLFLAPWKLSRPSLLQTHPPTKDRINRLLPMVEVQQHRLPQAPGQLRALLRSMSCLRGML